MSDASDFESRAMPPPKHVVTYTNFRGQPAIRVQGPQAYDAAGQEVVVTRKDGTQEKETLTERLWRGIDDRDFPGHPATNQPVAIYGFVRKPKEPFVQ